MIRQATVPIPVSGGVGSVTAVATNKSTGFSFPYLNGKCIQMGLIGPANASGSFYMYNPQNFIPISGGFSGGSWNWNGKAGLVGDFNLNILGSNGVYLLVFIFDDERNGH